MSRPAYNITRVGGKLFAGGLFWQVVTDNKSDTYDIARQLGCDLAVHRVWKSGIAQTGLAKTEDGYDKGMFSMAAAISKSLEMKNISGDWLGAWELPDGQWAFVAVRQAAITGTGDLIGEQHHAREAMEELYRHGNWETIIAPSEWGFPGSRSLPFDEILPVGREGKLKTYSWWMLKPVRKTTLSPKLIWRLKYVALPVLALAAAGIYFFAEHKEAPPPARGRLQIPVSPAVPAQTKPWLDQPSPQAVIHACDAVLTLERSYIAGWKLDSVECNAGQSVALLTWSRTAGGLVSWMRTAQPQAQLKADGTQASLSVPIHIEANASPPAVVPLAAADVIAAYWTTLTQVGATGSLTESAALPPPLPGQPAVASSWKKFTFKTEQLPGLLDDLWRIPALNISQISYVPGKPATINGTIYAQ